MYPRNNMPKRPPKISPRLETTPPLRGTPSSQEGNLKKSGAAPKKNVADSKRWGGLDGLRGIAVIGMIFYHFCYDLVFFRWIYIDFQNSFFWISARTIIVSLFILVAGVALYLAAGKRMRERVQRLAILGTCALLVSLGSYILFPARFIFFGVLHFFLLASVIGPLFVRLGHANLIVGAILLALGLFYQNPFFDQSWLQWLGLMTYKPASEDYVPLLPWFGILLWGIWLGHFMYGRAWAVHAWPLFLTWPGRHSLLIYMLHQPVLLGLLYGVKQLLG
jgi:uncharacterized membrane protein